MGCQKVSDGELYSPKEILTGNGAGQRDMHGTMIRGVFGLLSPAGPRSRLTILIFHRVLEQRDELFPNAIHAATFRERVQWIGSWFNVLPLDKAVAALRRGALPARALARSTTATPTTAIDRNRALILTASADQRVRD